MENEYELLKDNFRIFTGYGAYNVVNIDNTFNNDSLSVERVRLMGILDLKYYIQTGAIRENCERANLRLLQRGGANNLNYVQNGDVVLTRVTVSNEIEALYINQTPPEKCVYNSSVIVLRPKGDTVNSKFVYLILKEMSERHQLLKTLLFLAEKQNQRSIGVFVPKTISARILTNFKLKKYPLDKQNEIVKQYEKIEKQREALNKAENDFYENLDTMLK